MPGETATLVMRKPISQKFVRFKEKIKAGTRNVFHGIKMYYLDDYSILPLNHVRQPANTARFALDMFETERALYNASITFKIDTGMGAVWREPDLSFLPGTNADGQKLINQAKISANVAEKNIQELATQHFIDTMTAGSIILTVFMGLATSLVLQNQAISVLQEWTGTLAFTTLFGIKTVFDSINLNKLKKRLSEAQRIAQGDAIGLANSVARKFIGEKVKEVTATLLGIIKGNDKKIRALTLEVREKLKTVAQLETELGN